MSDVEQFIRHTFQQMNNPSLKPSPELTQALDHAMQSLTINQKSVQHFERVYKPFMLCIQESRVVFNLLALDCLGTLFQYDYWDKSVRDSLGQGKGFDKTGLDGLINLIIDGICNSFKNEKTDERVQLSVIKALASAITVENLDSALHGSQMLKAIRVIYNIFLISRSPSVQVVAQASLNQISNVVFSRVPKDYDFKKIMENHQQKLIKKSGMVKSDSGVLRDRYGMENGEFEDGLVGVEKDLGGRDSNTRPSQDILKDVEEYKEFDLIAKDAYLLFRAFCKLSMKSMNASDNPTDLKSETMRSKLLSLSLFYLTLKSYPHIFIFPSPVLFNDNINVSTESDVSFIIAVRRYICLVFTRNVSSIIPQVFDMSMDIFGRILLDLRFVMKKEISIIFTQIVIPIIEGSTAATFYQRLSCLRSLQRAFGRPDGGKVLVELYLNYDCEDNSENIWDRFVSALGKVITGNMIQQGAELATAQFTFNPTGYALTSSSSLTTSNLQNYSKEQIRQLYLPYGDPNELKRSVGQLLVKGVLNPLYSWVKDEQSKDSKKDSKDEFQIEDDQVINFEELKNKKQRLIEGIKMFNSKPKVGVRFLVEGKIIPSKAPRHIAHFLMNCPGLDKALIGEYLGEGDEINIQIMHCFVDLLDFSGISFVEALRKLLNTFRLPGEAQKIDRFMLKFAHRYLDGNPESFTSADTAYVLAYSTIMLNTDQHNPQVKRRMTVEDFIKNNRGIDEGKDLPVKILEGIYDEIRQNEIKIKEDKVDANNLEVSSNTKVNGVNSNSHSTKNLTPNELFGMIKKYNGATRDPQSLDSAFVSLDHPLFVGATKYGHIKPMFEGSWMSVLMVVTSCLQKGEELDDIVTSLEGFKYSIHLCCIFDLEMVKNGFLNNLGKFVDLNHEHLLEIKEKNVEAAKMLLEIAFIDGNHLKQNWVTVVKCISQIEKLQSMGITEVDPSKPSEQRKRENKHIEDLFILISSQPLTLSVDRVFSSSAKLNIESIGYFVRSLCEISWDEIISSSDKLIEVCHYNLNSRIRIEWTQIWATIGPHINQVGCHTNSNVVYFCVDKLRQLASKFLDLVELPNFKFQKSFLKAFLFIFENNPDIKIKDMVLLCINNMITQKSPKLKSGWKTILEVLSSASKENNEAIVKLGFNIVGSLHKSYLPMILSQNYYDDFVATLTKYCNTTKFPKISEKAVKILKKGAEKVGKAGGFASSPSNVNQDIIDPEEDPQLKVYLVTFRNMKNVILTCDLEVRSKALKDMFDLFNQNGSIFTTEFWLVVLKDIILPLFDQLTTEPTSRINKDESAVWMSTTMVEAFKLLIDLYSTYPVLIEIALDTILDLITTCILQENDTLAKLGSSCLFELIERNCHFFTEECWDKICSRIVKLMDLTRPVELYFDVEGLEKIEEDPTGISFSPKPSRSQFPKIVVKCVLHLVVIQTIYKFFNSPKSEEIYGSLNQKNVFNLGDSLYKSYVFAQRFNESMPIRQSLHQMGFMKQLPNLVKQETLSVGCYLSLLSKMFADKSPQQKLMSEEIKKRLSYKILDQFTKYDVEKQQASILAWTPVVESIVKGFINFSDEHFEDTSPFFYNFFIKLIGNEPFNSALQIIFARIGSTYNIPHPHPPFPSQIKYFPSLESFAEEELERIASSLVDMSIRESVGSIEN